MEAPKMDIILDRQYTEPNTFAGSLFYLPDTKDNPRPKYIMEIVDMNANILKFNYNPTSGQLQVFADVQRIIISDYE